MTTLINKAILFILFSCNVNLVVAQTAAEELSEILSAYETIKGDFNQILVDSKGEIIQESSGIFTIKAPGFFHWETKEPYPQLLIGDLKTIWLYDPDLEQVSISPYNVSIEQSPAMLLSGEPEQILAFYTVEKSTLIPDAYTLTPKQEGGNFTALELIFNNAILKNLILKDSLAQTTTFTIDNTKINDPVDTSIFNFEVPQGVDILTNE